MAVTTKKGSRSAKSDVMVGTDEAKPAAAPEPEVAKEAPVPAKDGVGGRYIELGGGVRVPASD